MGRCFARHSPLQSTISGWGALASEERPTRYLPADMASLPSHTFRKALFAQSHARLNFVAPRSRWKAGVMGSRRTPTVSCIASDALGADYYLPKREGGQCHPSDFVGSTRVICFAKASHSIDHWEIR
jgi:hypothetical protein